MCRLREEEHSDDVVLGIYMIDPWPSSISSHSLTRQPPTEDIGSRVSGMPAAFPTEIFMAVLSSPAWGSGLDVVNGGAQNLWG